MPPHPLEDETPVIHVVPMGGRVYLARSLETGDEAVVITAAVDVRHKRLRLEFPHLGILLTDGRHA